jgi:hypothetical protein
VSKLALTALQATLCMQAGGGAEQSGSPAKVGGVHAAETETTSQGLPNLRSALLCVFNIYIYIYIYIYI